MLAQLVLVRLITHSIIFHPEALIPCDYRCPTAQRDFRDLSSPHCFSFLFQQKTEEYRG